MVARPGIIVTKKHADAYWPLVEAHIMHDYKYGNQLFDHAIAHQKNGGYWHFAAKVLKTTHMTLCGMSEMSDSAQSLAFNQWKKLLKMTPQPAKDLVVESLRELIGALPQAKGNKLRNKKISEKFALLLQI